MEGHPHSAKTVKAGGCDGYFKCKEQHKTSRNLKSQGDMTLPKDHNNLSVTEPKDKEVYDLPNKEFKIAILRKLHELENTIQQDQENNTCTKWEV